jgi:hypothetical protein
MRTVVDLLQARVKENIEGNLAGKISGTLDGTGNLANSVVNDVSIDGNTIIGRVFGDGSVDYFDIQERGGQTPAHEIVVRDAKALRFLLLNGSGEAAETVFAMRVQHPGSKIMPKYFLRNSLKESLAVIRSLFSLDESHL